MGWFKNMLTQAAIKLLNIRPAQDSPITIYEPYTFQGNVLKNRIWYRGEASELDQFFKQVPRNNDLVAQSRFWAAAPTEGLNIRKMHSGLPALIVERLSDIVVADIDAIDLQNKELNDLWENISTENQFDKLIGESIVETLVTGDGAFRVSIDTDLTPYPIIEYFGGEKVDYTVKRGRIQEVIFYTTYTVENKDYNLQEIYGKGYIRYKLFSDDGKEVDLNIIPDTANLQDITFTGNFIIAVPMMFFKSAKFDGRGKSIFDTKNDSFDALDETISQWLDAIRDGRVKQYIPRDLIPQNPETGEPLKPNPFDNKYIATGSSMAEDAKNEISIQQPDIKYEAYVNTYASNLDMCLQGILSPATLGIDLKKTDNAEAQREKEKTTMYTRGKIVDILTEVIPEVVSIVLKANDLLYSKVPGEYESTISFGEYASPSFDTTVETVGKAKTYGIMSTEQCVEELYGDTWTDEDKATEVQRIKEESGGLQVQEPKPIDNMDLNNNGGLNE
jgi:hypothetical protein